MLETNGPIGLAILDPKHEHYSFFLFFFPFEHSNFYRNTLRKQPTKELICPVKLKGIGDWVLLPMRKSINQ